MTTDNYPQGHPCHRHDHHRGLPGEARADGPPHQQREAGAQVGYRHPGTLMATDKPDGVFHAAWSYRLIRRAL